MILFRYAKPTLALHESPLLKSHKLTVELLIPLKLPGSRGLSVIFNIFILGKYTLVNVNRLVGFTSATFDARKQCELYGP